MKKLLLLSFVVLFFIPHHAHASTQVIMGGQGTVAAAVAVHHYVLNAEGIAIGNGTAATGTTTMPFAGTFSNLTLTNTGVSPVVGTWIFTLMLNNASTTITCTPTGTGVCSTNSVSFNAGDGVDLAVDNQTNQTGVASGWSWSIVMTPTNSGDTFAGTGASTNYSATLNTYIIPNGITNATSESTSTMMLFGESGTLKNFYMSATSKESLSTATSSAFIRSGTFGLNTLATSTLTCSLSQDANATNGGANSNSGQCKDTTHTVSVSAGDAWDVVSQPLGTPTGAREFGTTVQFTPTVSGNFDWFANSGAAQGANTTRFIPVNGNAGTATAEASTSEQLAADTTVTGFTALAGTAATGAQTLTITLEKNGASSGMTCTITSSSNTCSATGSVAYVNNSDTINFKATLPAGYSTQYLIGTIATPTAAPPADSGGGTSQINVGGGFLNILNGWFYIP